MKKERKISEITNKKILRSITFFILDLVNIKRKNKYNIIKTLITFLISSKSALILSNDLIHKGQNKEIKTAKIAFLYIISPP